MTGTETPSAVTRVRLPSGELSIDVQSGSPWKLDDLLGFGVRRNPKRGYLLVSRVLGKHVPVSPLTIRAAHRALARQLASDLPGPLLFIGLAETATALGEGVAREWGADTKRTDFTFLHTTRYRQRGELALGFQEPHSHASSHLVYRPAGGEGQRHFAHARTLVLIDDELSTGATLENLARGYMALNPQLERLLLVSLTDLCPRHGELQAALDLPTLSVSLLRGHLSFAPDPAYTSPALPPVSGNDSDKTPLLAAVSARNGQDATRSPLLDAALDRLLQTPAGQSVLILGTGEFQYPPYLLALRLQLARPDLSVFNSATTRSPVLVWGQIGHALSFTDNYRDDIPNFVYNVAPGGYDQVWIGHEGQATLDPQLLTVLGAQALRLA
ncbi:phosphoribosyltransferase domain-containing protein [Deinococcus altitudinis]|uniref:phosphoribosyltransferase domain-containing protein n=1 Tax=Deinococcus altitudinis TaxID=468914 RepID=UPI003892CB5B